MRLIAKDSQYSIIDELFEPSSFLDFVRYFNSLDFAFRSMTGWQKVWRLDDGLVLAGAPHYHSMAPFKSTMDWLHQPIATLARDHFSEIVGVEGVDWHDILFVPYIYPMGTKISWHDDSAYTGAAIFYTHTEWNPHWGGELQVARTPGPEVSFDLNGITLNRECVAPLLNHYGMGTYISPIPNRLVFTAGAAWHAVNRVDQAAGDHSRCSIVAFFLKKKQSNE